MLSPGMIHCVYFDLRVSLSWHVGGRCPCNEHWINLQEVIESCIVRAKIVKFYEISKKFLIVRFLILIFLNFVFQWPVLNKYLFKWQHEMWALWNLMNWMVYITWTTTKVEKCFSAMPVALLSWFWSACRGGVIEILWRKW